MIRDPKTPLLLWIAVIGIAVRAHMFAADGGDFIALVHNDHKALAELGAQARERVRQREQTFDVEGLGLGPKTAEETIQQPPPPKPPEPKKEPKKDEAKPEKTPEQKKEEEKKKLPLLVKKEEKTPPPQPQPMQPDKRIAVRQHAKANQADNPNAKFIGDEANHVDQETVATQTSHDQDDPNPTPGGNHAGPQDKVGDSERTKIAESEEHAGDKNRAPGEKGTEFDVQPVAKPLGPMAMLDPKNPPPQAGGDGRPAAAPARETPAPAQVPPAANPSGADVQDANNGGWSFNPIRPGAPSGFAPAPAGPSNTAQGRAASGPAMLGLGGRAAPGQVNLNLTHQGIVAIVGQDQLRKERQADGERRKSEHRGSWTASNFERWRSAIENYVSSVKPGNQTALNTAAVPFATYLNGMHNRIHPLFADSFLNSLDNLPATHPLNDIKLMTRLEIVLTRDGHLVKMGIVKTSGVTAFDIAALDAVQRASPFSVAPGAIVSPDGKVYLHWEFHRDEVYACSTMNARPFMLNTPAPQPPADPLPPPSTPIDPSRERGAPSNTRDVREGRRVRPSNARSS